MLKKAYKNKPLTKWGKRFNKLISKTRFKVAHTFGGIKSWFKRKGKLDIEGWKKCIVKI